MLTSIIIILVIYALIFYIIPWLSRQLMVLAARRMARKFARSMGFDDDAFEASDAKSKKRGSRRNAKTKRYDSAEGEYVAFEVIDNEDTTHGAPYDTPADGRASNCESRIVDVEWEELPGNND